MADDTPQAVTPQPAAAAAAFVRELPQLPSNTAIITERNQDLALMLLNNVREGGFHRRPAKVADVVGVLWNGVDGPLDGQYREFVVVVGSPSE